MDKKELQNAFDSGERIFLDYIEEHFIRGLDDNNKNGYLKALYNSVSWLQESLWYSESFDLDIKEQNLYNQYMELRDLLLVELGINLLDNN